MSPNISDCKKCSLYKNQKISLDELKQSDVMWLGISAQKESSFPLSPDTNSGKFIQLVEEKLKDKAFYKTNLCKCLPLDGGGKIRYPEMGEFEICFDNFLEELDIVQPKVVVLLGKKISDFISEKFDIKLKKYTLAKYDGVYFLYIDHPSYLMIYKRKELEGYIDIIQKVLW